VIAWCVAALLAAVTWNASPDLRATVSKFFTDYQLTKIQNIPTGKGSRLEFWQ
jgi:O-antigen ligase